jgi:hypothetical protein
MHLRASSDTRVFRESYLSFVLQKRGHASPGLSQGMHGLPLDTSRTCVLLEQAGETATLAGETRSPHKPPTVPAWTGRCGNSIGATGVHLGVARPVDGPPETALGRWPQTVKRLHAQTERD